MTITSLVLLSSLIQAPGVCASPRMNSISVQSTTASVRTIVRSTRAEIKFSLTEIKSSKPENNNGRSMRRASFLSNEGSKQILNKALIAVDLHAMTEEERQLFPGRERFDKTEWYESQFKSAKSVLTPEHVDEWNNGGIDYSALPIHFSGAA